LSINLPEAEKIWECKSVSELCDRFTKEAQSQLQEPSSLTSSLASSLEASDLNESLLSSTTEPQNTQSSSSPSSSSSSPQQSNETPSSPQQSDETPPSTTPEKPPMEEQHKIIHSSIEDLTLQENVTYYLIAAHWYKLEFSD
jgi:hypothetical protein